jgi:hypothetical protein
LSTCSTPSWASGYDHRGLARRHSARKDFVARPALGNEAKIPNVGQEDADVRLAISADARRHAASAKANAPPVCGLVRDTRA